jgi:hypothetical protein
MAAEAATITTTLKAILITRNAGSVDIPASFPLAAIRGALLTFPQPLSSRTVGFPGSGWQQRHARL